MATRRSHNKTRLGCSQCKKRRIKCDGKHPKCFNCEKKGLDCSFLNLVPSSRLTASSASPTHAPTTSPTTFHPSSITTPPSTELAVVPKTPPFQSHVQVFRQSPPTSTAPSPPPPPLQGQSYSPSFADTELHRIPGIPPALRFNDVWKSVRESLAPHLRSVLFHYEYTTSLTLATDDPAKAAWQAFVPELASQHNFLVHCCLSIASLHLGRLHESRKEKEKMMAIAATQMNKALAQYRPALANVNQENAAALFASATLTAVYFFRTSTLEIEEIRASIPSDTVVPPPEVVDKMVNSVIKTIWGLRGPLTVLIPGWQWVMGGKMMPVAARKWWPKERVPATDRARDEDQRLCAIESLWRHPGCEYEDHFDCLAEALWYLRETYALVSQLTVSGTEYPPTTSVPYSVDDTSVGSLKDRGAIFVWATRISREFIQLFEQKNREALVIVAHYGVLPARVRNVWWLEGLGAHMITAVAMALGPDQWHLIEWPAKVAGVNLENAFGVRRDPLEGTPEEMCMDVI